jgi:uncharacterized repeat protein (TIGR02543 family)
MKLKISHLQKESIIGLQIVLVVLLTFNSLYASLVFHENVSAGNVLKFIETSLNSTMFGEDAVVVDPGLTIDLKDTSLHSSGLVYSAQVRIENFVAGDELSVGELTLTPAPVFDATQGVLSIRGQFTQAQLQAILRRVEFRASSSMDANSTQRTITFTLSPDNLYNNRYFEFVYGSSITLVDAKAAAESSRFFGLQGYLYNPETALKHENVQAIVNNEAIFPSLANQTRPLYYWVGIKVNQPANGNINNNLEWLSGPNLGVALNPNDFPGGLYPFPWTNAEDSQFSLSEPYVAVKTDDGKWADTEGANAIVTGYLIEYGGFGVPADFSQGLSATKQLELETPQQTVVVSQTSSTVNASTVRFSGLDSSFTQLKYAVVPHGWRAPTSSEIRAGTYNNALSFIASNTLSTSGTETSTTIADLPDHFLLDVYAVQLNGSNQVVNTTLSLGTIFANTIRAAYTFNRSSNRLADVTNQKASLTALAQPTKTSAVSYIDGPVDKALVFNGGTYYNLPNDLIRGGDPFSPFTISLYFKTDTKNQTLLGYNQTDTPFTSGIGQHIPILNIDNNGRLDARLWLDNLNRDLIAVSDVRVDDNQWHKVIISSFGNSLSVYLNDVKLNLLQADASGVVNHLSMNLNTLGTGISTALIRWPNLNNYLVWRNAFVGSMDEIIFINAGLTQAQIEATSNEVAIEYELNGGSFPVNANVQYLFSRTSTTAYTLPIPVRTGFNFDGWYTDAELSADLVTEVPVGTSTAFKVHAKWSAGASFVSFDANGGSLVSPLTVNYNDFAIQPANPTRSGYTFAGWASVNDNAASSFDFNNTRITSNLTLYAKWNRNAYTITYNSNGGSSVASASVEYLDKVIRPSNPTRASKVFKGWFKDEALVVPFDFENEQVTANITLYARWSDVFRFDFESNDGSYVAGFDVELNTAAPAPVNPTKLGHSFVGWYTNADLMSAYDFSTLVTQNTTVFAKWSKNSYNLSFNTQGGSANPASQSRLYGELASSTPSAPTKIGHTFVGWSTNASMMDAWDFNLNRVYSNTTLYAIWRVNEYELTYQDENGNILLTQTVAHGQAARTPTNLRRPGLRFLGWNNPSNLITGALTFVPLFEEIVVAVRSNGPSLRASVANAFSAIPFSDSELQSAVGIVVEINERNDQTVNASDKDKFDALALSVLPEGSITSLYLDIKPIKVVNGVETILSELDDELIISFEVPLAFRNRFFELIRVHNGVAEVIPFTYTSINHTVTFASDKFSTYGLTVSTASGELIALPNPGSTNSEVTIVSSVQDNTPSKTLIIQRPREASRPNEEDEMDDQVDDATPSEPSMPSESNPEDSRPQGVPWWVYLLGIVGVSIATGCAYKWWFILAKRRRKKDEEKQKRKRLG